MRITTNQPRKIDSINLQIENEINKTIKIDGKENGSIHFSDRTENCCVGMVDMMNSTKTSASLSSHQFCKYYSIFINSMTSIARNYDAIVVKNIGDCILFYFPNSSYDADDAYKKNCLECCFAMIEIHDFVNKKLQSEGLPSLNYRVSIDFGTIMIAKSDTSIFNDIFGNSVNMCSKFNRYAEKNGLIVGGDLYQIMKKLNEFKFKFQKDIEVGIPRKYPVYRVTRNTSSCSTIIKKIIDSNESSCDEKTNRALVGMAIEKAIVKLGVPKLSYFTGRLYNDYNLSLFDCYVTPVYLKTILKDLYGNSYGVVVNLMEHELGNTSKEISEFMDSLKPNN